jgi:cobalt/nickel transport system permease protein
MAGYISLSLASIVTAVEFGIQPIIAAGADGNPLYAPYHLSIAIPAMAIEHMALFSIVEGIVTVMILKYFMKNEPGLLYGAKEERYDKIP